MIYCINKTLKLLVLLIFTSQLILQIDVKACVPTGGGNPSAGANLVIFGDMVNKFGNNPLATGYANYTSSADTAQLCIGKEMWLTIGTSNSLFAPPLNMTIEVYIDFDNDSSFSGPGEQVLVSLNHNGLIGYPILIPNTVLPGVSHMRIMVHSGPPINDPFTILQPDGDIEDYTVEFVNCSVTSYCEPAVLVSSENVGVNSMRINDSVLTADEAKGYNDFTEVDTITVCRGNEANIELENSWESGIVSVWVDYNQDGDFNDANEAITLEQYMGFGLTVAKAIRYTIPASASLGYTRMRIIVGSVPTSDPCADAQDGMIQDYTINIVDCDPCAGGVVGGITAFRKDSVLGPCSNQTVYVSMDESQLSGSGDYSYIWWWDDGATVQDTTSVPYASYTYSTAGYRELWVAVTDSACGVIEKWFYVGMQQKGRIGFSGGTSCFTNPGSVCIGDIAKFSSIACTGSAGGIWDMGDGTPLIDAVNFQHWYIYDTVGTFTVTMYNKEMCNPTSKVITVNPPPVASFTESIAVGCPGINVTFTDVSTPGPASAAITGWDWQFNDNANNTSTIQNPVNDYLSPGVYSPYLEVTDANGCKATTANAFQIGDSTIADFTYTEGCPCNSITFNAIGSSNAWAWDFGDGNTSSSQNPTHIYSLPGEYYVALIADNASGCQGKKEIKLTVCGNDIRPDTSKSDNNWVLGGGPNGGVTFNTSPPTNFNPYPTNTQGNDAMTATISDPNTGELLFYVESGDAGIVKNKLNMRIADNLEGKFPVILPVPGNKNQYYIFSIGSCFSVIKGTNTPCPAGSILWESKIDMSQPNPNGGMGLLIEYNNIVQQGVLGRRVIAIQKTAPGNCEGIDPIAAYWLIVQASESPTAYFKFLVDSSGVSLNSTQVIGTVNPKSTYVATVAPNDRMFAVAGSGGVEVFSFDKYTGNIYNPRVFSAFGPGMAFSPNSDFLYCGGGTYGLYQLDLNAASPQGTAIQLHNGWTWYTPMRLASDDKIYLPGLGVINNPDQKGLSANFVEDIGVFTNVGANESNNIIKYDLTLELDTPIVDFEAIVSICPSPEVILLNKSTYIPKPTDLCSYYAKDTIEYLWYFGDGDSSYAYQPGTHIYADSGDYNIMLIITRNFMCNYKDTMVQSVRIDLPPVLSFTSDSACYLDTTHIISNVQGVVNQPFTFSWSSPVNGIDSNPQVIMPFYGSYEVIMSIIDSLGCIFEDTNTIIVHEIPVAENYDTTICKGSELMLKVGLGNTFEWSPGTYLNNTIDNNQTFTPTETINYKLITNTIYCGSDTGDAAIEVLVCDIFIPNAFSPNNDGENDIFNIREEGVESLSIKIYDRWGNNVFETKDKPEGWQGINKSGTFSNQGVYVYRIQYVLINGVENEIRGNITLIR